MTVTLGPTFLDPLFLGCFKSNTCAGTCLSWTRCGIAALSIVRPSNESRTGRALRRRSDRVEENMRLSPSLKFAAAHVAGRHDPVSHTSVRKSRIDLSRDQTIAWVRVKHVRRAAKLAG